MNKLLSDVYLNLLTDNNEAMERLLADVLADPLELEYRKEPVEPGNRRE